MKYNFEKLLNIPKYQGGGDVTGEGVKSYVALDNRTRKNRYTNLLGWSGADKQWLTEEGLYDFEKMYQDFLLNKDDFDISVITETPDWENASVNKRGYLDWNRLYNTSGLNKYFGYSDLQADYYGPTTSARKAFLDYVKLRELERLRQGEVTIGGGGSGGGEGEVKIGGSRTGMSTTVGGGNSYSSNYGLINALQFDPNLKPPEPDPWTDFLPLTAQLGNDLMSASRQRDLLAKKVFPHITGPHKNYIKTNGYFLRAAMHQNAADLLHRAEMQNGSDMTTNMANMQAAGELADTIENQAEAIEAEKDAEARLKFEETINDNKEVDANVFNFNNKSNVASMNNILDARSKYDLSRTAALNSYIGNMYTSHGEWLKDARLNQQGYLRGVNLLTASSMLQNALNALTDARDFTKSLAYQSFSDYLKEHPDALEGLTDEQLALITSDEDSPERQKLLQEIFLGNSDIAKNYRGQWENDLNAAWKTYIGETNRIENWLGAQNLLLPQVVTNQGVYKPLDMQYLNPLYRYYYGYGAGYLAKGGSVRARFIDYERNRSKELQSVRKEQQKANEQINKKLAHDLDMISKEQMILLKSIFK